MQYVDPFIGTGTGQPGYGLGNEGGHVFPGAAYPQGMVQWSPDTTNAAGGYRYTQHAINGFSLTHFSGRGCSAYQDFPFTPVNGPLTTSPVAGLTTPYSHADEQAMPGYYRVRLAGGIQVALTVTPRTGFGVFTYPAGRDATLLINAGGSANGDSATGTGVRITGPMEVTGSASSGHFCGNNIYTVYFDAQFDRPWQRAGTWNGPTLNPGSAGASGSHAGAYLTFRAMGGATTVRVKVGISFVSVTNARANLLAEDPGWNFDAVRAAAGTAWNARLNQIQVEGGTQSERIVFYTALYHTLFHPNIFSDVNGQYIGFDGTIHVAPGYTQYENFPGWDMYRSLAPLRALLQPAAMSNMLQSLVADAEQGGGGLPRWEVANDNSGGMVGDSQDIVIATAYALGATHFDTGAALKAMEYGASQPGARSGRDLTREGLADYLAHGYVAEQTIGGSASRTLEYAADDFALARFVQALGANVGVYEQRSRNWRTLYNFQTGYLEPRARSGAFAAGFSPTSQNGFTEGDAAQYLWAVPCDLHDLFALLGGNAAVVRRLDTHFTQLNAGPASVFAFMGNEPEFEVPWEYDFAGAPYRTQAVVRRIETDLFSATPDGLPGNDDGGAMSAWYVFAALGLYPEIPGVAGFVLGSPLFPRATVHLGNGHVLTIVGDGAAPTAPYVQSLTVNGQPYASPWLPYTRLAAGATLRFTLGPTPDRAWGAAPDEAPPSFP